MLCINGLLADYKHITFISAQINGRWKFLVQQQSINFLLVLSFPTETTKSTKAPSEIRKSRKIIIIHMPAIIILQWKSRSSHDEGIDIDTVTGFPNCF